MEKAGANYYKDGLDARIDEFETLGHRIYEIIVSPTMWEVIKDSTVTFHNGSKSHIKYRAYTVKVDKEMKGKDYEIAVISYNYYGYSI